MFGFAPSTETCRPRDRHRERVDSDRRPARIELIKNPEPVHPARRHRARRRLVPQRRHPGVPAQGRRDALRRARRHQRRRTTRRRTSSRRRSQPQRQPGIGRRHVRRAAVDRETSRLCAFARRHAPAKPVYNFALARVRYRDTTRGAQRAAVLPHVAGAADQRDLRHGSRIPHAATTERARRSPARHPRRRDRRRSRSSPPRVSTRAR